MNWSRNGENVDLGRLKRSIFRETTGKSWSHRPSHRELLRPSEVNPMPMLILGLHRLVCVPELRFRAFQLVHAAVTSVISESGRKRLEVECVADAVTNVDGEDMRKVCKFLAPILQYPIRLQMQLNK